MRTYDGQVSIRRLEPRDVTIDYDALASVRELLHYRPYERDILELIRAAHDSGWRENVDDLSSLFCSELVAKTYEVLGLIHNTKPSNEYTPKDFSTETGADIRFVENVQLGVEIPLS